MDKKVIVLPQAEEMIKRLTTVYDDELAQRLYRNVAQWAGKKKVAGGVVIMFTSGIYDVCQRYTFMQDLMHGFVPMWIDALIDDKDVANEAKAFHKQATDAARK